MVFLYDVGFVSYQPYTINSYFPHLDTDDDARHGRAHGPLVVLLNLLALGGRLDRVVRHGDEPALAVELHNHLFWETENQASRRA